MYLKMILYGRPGSGKTRVSHTAAWDKRSAPALVLDAAGNPMSTRDYGADRRPTIIPISELKDLNDPWKWFAGGQPQDGFAKQFNLTVTYKTIILDQLTEIQRYAFNEVMGLQKYGPGDIPPKKEWDHFNKVLMAMINVGSYYFQKLNDVHVIACVQERTRTDETTGRSLNMMVLEGQSIAEVPSYCYAVGRLVPQSRLSPVFKKELKEGGDECLERVAFFEPGPSYPDAKDQYGGLSPYVVDPTIGKILDLVTHKVKE